MYGIGKYGNTPEGKKKKDSRKSKSNDGAYKSGSSDTMFIIPVAYDRKDKTYRTENHSGKTRAAADK